MDLARIRRIIRPVVSVRTEYFFRRTANLALPSNPAAVPSAYHCCNWKTGSQWVRLVLSDPRFFRASGLTPTPFTNELGTRPSPAVSRRRQRPEVGTPLFADTKTFGDLGLPAGSPAVFVTRDPRDLLVSYYFTNLENHPLNADVAIRREQLLGVNAEEGMLLTMTHGFDQMIELGDSWAEAGEVVSSHPVRVFRYEDLSGADAEREWAEMLTHLAGRGIETKVVRALLGTYSAENMRGGGGGRPSKIRAGEGKAWHQHFSPAVEAEFERRYGQVVERWGYK